MRIRALRQVWVGRPEGQGRSSNPSFWVTAVCPWASYLPSLGLPFPITSLEGKPLSGFLGSLIIRSPPRMG